MRGPFAAVAVNRRENLRFPTPLDPCENRLQPTPRFGDPLRRRGSP